MWFRCGKPGRPSVRENTAMGVLIPSMSLLHILGFFFFLTECGSYGNILDILKDNDIEVNE